MNYKAKNKNFTTDWAAEMERYHNGEKREVTEKLCRELTGFIDYILSHKFPNYKNEFEDLRQTAYRRILEKVEDYQPVFNGREISPSTFFCPWIKEAIQNEINTFYNCTTEWYNKVKIRMQKKVDAYNTGNGTMYTLESEPEILAYITGESIEAIKQVQSAMARQNRTSLDQIREFGIADELEFTMNQEAKDTEAQAMEHIAFETLQRAIFNLPWKECLAICLFWFNMEPEEFREAEPGVAAEKKMSYKELTKRLGFSDERLTRRCLQRAETNLQRQPMLASEYKDFHTTNYRYFVRDTTKMVFAKDREQMAQAFLDFIEE